MNGTVVDLRRVGVIAQLDGFPNVGDLFQIYRIENGVETILGNGYLRKSRGQNLFKINPMEDESGNRGEPFVGIQLGDLVRSA